MEIGPDPLMEYSISPNLFKNPSLIMYLNILDYI